MSDATKMVHHRDARFIPVDVRAIGPRAINTDTSKKFQYGYGEKSDGSLVHVAQYFSDTGKLEGQKIRTPSKEFYVLGDVGGRFFGQHLWRDKGRKLVVCEGELDALSMSQIQNNKWPVVSVPTGAKGAPGVFKAQLEWLEGFDEVVIIFDQDDVGRQYAEEAAAMLSPGRAKIVTLPDKDPNKLLMAGKITALTSAVWDGKPYYPEDVFFGGRLLEEIERWKDIPSIPYPQQSLQDMTRGIRPGEITVVMASPGAGKSTYCRELGCYLLKQPNTKVAMLVLESSIYDNTLGMLTPLVNRPLHLAENPLEQDDVREALEELGDRLIICKPKHRSAEKILSKIRYLVRGMGVTHLILDNLSIVVGSSATSDERRFIDELLMGLESLTDELEFWLGLVVHVKRAGKKDKFNPGHDRGQELSQSDARGSGMLEGIAFDMIGLERDQQEQSNTTLRLLKCRNTGWAGKACEMVYNRETGRLMEDIGL